MSRTNIFGLALPAARRAIRAYRSHMPISEFMMRVKFRDLPRDFYDKLWQDAARNVGAEASRWHGSYHKIRRGDLTTVVAHSQVSLNNVMLHRLLIDKSITQELLRERGYPVPDNLTFEMKDFAEAEAFFEEHNRHVAIKPAEGTGGGRGVTTDITDLKTVRSSARFALRYGSKVLIEQHAGGSSYRLMFLGGKFVDAVRRDPPAVTGDGESTIEGLMAKENSRRLRERPVSALSPVTTSLDCRLTLSKQGLHLKSRPQAGREVRLKNVVNENCAAQNHNVRDQVHPEVIEMGARLMKDLGITLGGIDVQIEDISKPFLASGGLILEVNSPAAIHHHYLLDDPVTRYPVAESILEYIFSNQDGVFHDRTP